jgi:hypothetical protein
LAGAAEDSRDVKALKRKALEAMALSYYAVPSDISRSEDTDRENAGQHLTWEKNWPPQLVTPYGRIGCLDAGLKVAANSAIFDA